MTIKKDYDKYRAAVLDEMAKSESDTDANIKKYLMSIILACMSGYKKDFTFSKNRSIEKKVDNILDELSGTIYLSISKRAKKSISQAFEKTDNKFKSDIFIAFMGVKIEGKSIADRINAYISNFKTEIEAYIAIGLASGYSSSKIYSLWLSNKKKPYDYLLIRQNIGKFKAEGLNKDLKIGRGYSTSSFMGFKDLEMNNTFQAYNYGLNKIWEEDDKIIGWYTIRGSNYPCELCDSFVGKFHDQSEIFYGYHPRCCCIMIPVTEKGEAK